MSSNMVGIVENGKSEKYQDGRIPKSMYFILVTIFSERVCSGGILAVLAIFLHEKLNFNNDQSTSLFHVNEFVLYFFTIVGAIVADSWLGLFKTISWMSFSFFIGAATLTFTSIEILGLPIKTLSLLGLIVLVASSGGIKSNQGVFGGNQFKLPEQKEQLNTYFSVQYFFVKCGLVTGQIFYPILRKDVKCFGEDDCYPLAFGTSAVLMLISLLLFFTGKSSYVHVAPTENMFVKVIKCIMYALTQKLIKRKVVAKSHWLDYAEDKYGPKLVNEAKIVLNILKIFLCLPIFWGLYAQVNSRWVFQASKMNGDIGFYEIKPDQMAMLTTLFIIFLIPLFDFCIYPFLRKFGVTSPFHKMTIGFFCSASAFILAAIVEWKIQENFISILWLVPQLFILAMSEVFVYVSTQSFCYTQAPESMKSVMASFLYLSVAGGNLLIIIISGSNFIKSQILEFLFYSGLMIANTICFIFISKHYVFVNND